MLVVGCYNCHISDWKIPFRSHFTSVIDFRSQYSHYCTVALISHTSKVLLKILQAKLPQYMDWEIQGVQVGFRKGRWTRGQIASICWIIEKERELQKKTSTSASLTMLKALTVQFSSVQSLSRIQLFVIPWRAAHQSSLSIWLCGSQSSCGKFFKR